MLTSTGIHFSFLPEGVATTFFYVVNRTQGSGCGNRRSFTKLLFRRATLYLKFPTSNTLFIIYRFNSSIYFLIRFLKGDTPRGEVLLLAGAWPAGDSAGRMKSTVAALALPYHPLLLSSPPPPCFLPSCPCSAQTLEGSFSAVSKPNNLLNKS